MPEIAFDSTPTEYPVLGIYLAYYESYGVAGVNRFKSFLENLGTNVELIVVCNSSVFDILRDFPAHVIHGNNVLREFSGWESGLIYARSIGIDLDKYLLVFANDTFCYHNNFGPITRFAFSRTFRRMKKKSHIGGIAGEIWRFDGVFEIDGFTSDRWIATYFFALSGEVAKKIALIHPDPPIGRFFSPDSEQLQFSGLVSPNLARHMIKWLSGYGSASWKNPARTDVSAFEHLRGKANSIICEKYLSAKVNSVGGLLIDVFEAQWIRRLRRLETLYSRIEKHFRRK